MNQELAKKLNEDFPQIFNDQNEPLSSFGFECGSGWFQVIYDLCSDLMKISQRKGYELPVATQVKEKFGGLRFYIEGCQEGYHERIQIAEELSVATCEVCGRRGKRIDAGWVQTLCDKHAKH